MTPAAGLLLFALGLLSALGIAEFWAAVDDNEREMR